MGVEYAPAVDPGAADIAHAGPARTACGFPGRNWIAIGPEPGFDRETAAARIGGDKSAVRCSHRDIGAGALDQNVRVLSDRNDKKAGADERKCSEAQITGKQTKCRCTPCQEERRGERKSGNSAYRAWKASHPIGNGKDESQPFVHRAER
jgi:hypothetical protein